jgi:hypothetical protein
MTITQVSSGLLLGLATIFTVAAVLLGIAVWRRQAHGYIAFVHLSTMVLLLFVCLGSWGTFLGSTGTISPDAAGFLGAMGRGSLLTLSIYFLLLYRHHLKIPIPRSHRDDDRS